MVAHFCCQQTLEEMKLSVEMTIGPSRQELVDSKRATNEGRNETSHPGFILKDWAANQTVPRKSAAALKQNGNPPIGTLKTSRPDQPQQLLLLQNGLSFSFCKLTYK